MNFNKLQGIEGIKTPENKIKEGVDFVFEQNPELLGIGTKEQYSEYLDTIFPESNVKDILYHGTYEKNKVLSEGFNLDKIGSSEGTSLQGKGFYFSDNRDSVRSYSKDSDISNIISVFINTKNNLNRSNFVDFIKKELGVSTAFNVTDWGNKVEEYLIKNNVDSVSWKQGKDQYNNYCIRTSEQIHILGSKQDLEKFKEFVSKIKL